MTNSITGTCNRALSLIGARSQISSLSPPAPVGPESFQCGLWYDKMRRNLLRTAQWGFARFQLPLTLLGDSVDQTAPFPYLYKYAYPSDAIKLRYILPMPVQPSTSPPAPPNVSGGPLTCGWMPSRSFRWLVASDLDGEGNQIKVILSNVPNAMMVYTKDIDNPTLFDDLFDTALSTALGAAICLPLTGNVGMMNSMMARTEAAIRDARVGDGNEAVTFNDHIPDWIETRGWPPPSSFSPGFYPQGTINSWGSWFGGNDNMNWSS